MRTRKPHWLLLGLSLVPALLLAQQGAATPAQIVIGTTSLPKIYLRQPVHIELNAQGGVGPLRWQVTGGDLPAGLSLSEDGVLTGAATKPPGTHPQALLM